MVTTLNFAESNSRVVTVLRTPRLGDGCAPAAATLRTPRLGVGGAPAAATLRMPPLGVGGVHHALHLSAISLPAYDELCLRGITHCFILVS